MTTDTAIPICVRPLRCSSCNTVIRVLELGPDDEVPREQCANCKLDTAQPRWMNGEDRSTPMRDGGYTDEDGDGEREDLRYTCPSCGRARFRCTITEVISADTRDNDYDDEYVFFEQGYGERESQTTCANCFAVVPTRMVTIE